MRRIDTTLGVRTRLCVLALFLLVQLCGGLRSYAQDCLPDTARLDQKMSGITEQRLSGSWNDTLSYVLNLPASFRLSVPNRIADPTGSLDVVWEQLRRLRSGADTDTLRVLHIGDSHVRGHIYPRTAGGLLMSEFQNLVYTDFGINGATCLTFTHADRLQTIGQSEADWVIVSFGTNESHNRRYNAHLHYQQLDELLALIRERLPHAAVLLTTPPGSYDRYWVRRKRTYKVNPRTAEASATIARYAADHGMAVWNLYEIAGGQSDACANWQRCRLMRPDHVHYFAEGYVLQGSLLYQAILNAYNSYVVR